MFEGLGDRLQRVLKDIRGEGALTDHHLDTALREIRISLIEADVALPVVKDVLGRIGDAAVGARVTSALSPVQEVTRIVRDELQRLLGHEAAELDTRSRPLFVMLVGLQGSGKTTSAAKLGKYLRDKRGRHPMLVPCDLSRPAAVEQLQSLGRRLQIPVFEPGDRQDPVSVARDAVTEAGLTGRDAVIFDTAGRLHVDQALMDELGRFVTEVHPSEILFVADAMTGQDAVRSAGAFAARLPLTGVIFTKTDGDARGGAALTIVSTLGKPIKFVGTGEKIEDLEIFHPDRMASRILGMGDVLSLIDRVQESIDAKEAERIAERAANSDFSLDDLRDQLGSMKKLGSMAQLLDFLPKVGPLRKLGAISDVDPKALTRMEAILSSMTSNERSFPQILNGSRRKRIARGSGTKVEDVNRLLKQYLEMKKMMKMLKGKSPIRLQR